MSDNYQYVTCRTCRGSKFMMKLGGIYGECNTCHGSGQVRLLTLNKKEEEPENLSKSILDIPKKKPGRPKLEIIKGE